MNAPTILRRIVQLGSRRVHLRHAGSGPRLLLIHSSPANSDFLVPQLEQLAGDYCCIAPDTPGFGESDPLPPGAASIADVARATAELLESLDFTPCLVFGSHTGAAVALELALQRPDLVAGLVLDGVALFNAAEAPLFEGYFEALQVDARGGHYARTWTRIRDMFMWFPWTSHDPARLNGVDLPPPANAQRWVSMFFQAAPRYAEVYRAAIEYGTRALTTVVRQPRPALYMAHERDMLAPHLQRLPKLKATDHIEMIPASAPERWLATLRQRLAAHVASETVSAGALVVPTAAGEQEFIDTAEGQLRLRRFGDPRLPPLLLLHDAPASGLSLLALARDLATSHCVWLPDLPGCGGSTALRVATPTLAEYAGSLAPLLARLGADAPLLVYGRGCGAAVALALARLRPDVIARLLLDELPVAVPGIEVNAEQICAPIVIEADGAHWFRTWLMLRDSQVFWPWYQTSASRLLKLPGNFAGDFLHDWVLQVMQQPATAHCLPRAAHAGEVDTLLAQASVPVLLLGRNGHPLTARAAALAQQLPGLRALRFEDAERTGVLQRVLSAAA